MIMTTDDQIFLKINKGREIYNRLTNNGTTPITEEQAKGLSSFEKNLIFVYWFHGDIDWEYDLVATESFCYIMD